jgi:hypothetical protein
MRVPDRGRVTNAARSLNVAGRKRYPNAKEGEQLLSGRLRQIVERVVYDPDDDRVYLKWSKDEA